jgi:hypothetical protein
LCDSWSWSSELVGLVGQAFAEVIGMGNSLLQWAVGMLFVMNLSVLVLLLPLDFMLLKPWLK